MKAVFALIVCAAVLLSASATAQEPCRRSTSCEELLGRCQDHRRRNNLTREELPCEKSAAVCRKTGVWRGKYMRGTPEVNACRIFTPKT